MNTIDYVYRFVPHNPSTKPPPTDAEAARKSLEDGNRMFARWMSSCRTGTFTRGEEPRHVVQCNGLEVGMVRKEGGVPKQAPFAVVIGCSDARVPTDLPTRRRTREISPRWPCRWRKFSSRTRRARSLSNPWKRRSLSSFPRRLRSQMVILTRTTIDGMASARRVLPSPSGRVRRRSARIDVRRDLSNVLA